MNGWVEGLVRQRGFWPPAKRAPAWRSVPGFVRGPWGLSQEPDGRWNLTHTPSGCSAGWFRRRRSAASFADALDHSGIDWPAVTLENYGATVAPHRDDLERIKRRRRSFRGAPTDERADAYVRRKAGTA